MTGVTVAAQHPADLEPSRVADSTYVTRRRYARIDGATLLSVMICLLMLIPARLILPGLTDIGRPALVVALSMGFWWLATRLNSRLAMGGPNPIRFAVLIYVVAMLISYAAGFLRGLTVIEANGADRAMLSLLGFIGVILVAADGLPNWERLRGVLRVFVWCSAIMAVVGLLQSILQIDLTGYIVVPGLQPKGWVPTFETRGAGVRVASTAAHYIEFSVVMAIALPVAIHFARFDERRRRVFTVFALLIAAAIPATISRTGVVAVTVAIVALVPVWGWRMRYNMLGFAMALMAVLVVVKPGLFGTIRDLFTGASQDSSVQARTERYGLVAHFFAQRPWLGRGTGTWIPPQYQILDNQWLALALSNGLLGVAALATLHISAIVLAGLALKRSSSPEVRHLCAALIAAQLVAILVAAFFDSLSFTTYATVLALMTGLAGAVWRFTHPSRIVRTSTTRWFTS